MEVKDESELEAFSALLDEYDRSFATGNIELFRSLHVTDDNLVFYDNHAGCDSNRYVDHEAKVLQFFRSGKVGSISRENVRVFREGRMACITAMLRYVSVPRPGVRTTYVLELEQEGWKVRHMHHSFDPNETDAHA